MSYADSLYRRVIVSPQPNHRYRLLHNLRFRDVVVPAGYITNGADIPRVFWSIIPPNDSSILPAVIVHDYLCDIGYYEKADNTFDEVLRALEVPELKRKVLVGAVKFYTRWIR